MSNKQVTIRGRHFEIREAPIGEVIDHMGLLSSDPSKFQRILAQASVMEGGAFLGDALMSLGVRSYIDLVTEVMKVNGFAGDDEGNE